MIGVYHYIAAGLFAAFALLDLFTRARVFPEVSYWRMKGIAFAFLYLAITTTAPLIWDAWLDQYQLVDGSRLPFWLQVAGGFVVLQFGIYTWHRTMHHVTPLWRFFHQMHHSAERVDIWGALYFHPLDMIGWAFIGSMMLVLGFGLSVEAALIVNVMATFCSMFQHANINTPQWLGYLVTRPESHSAHHERGIHGRNYGDIPLFDMIFGTFYNPAKFEGEVGFHEGGSRKLGAMLIGRMID